MYLPELFRVDDQDTSFELIDTYPFATVILAGAAEPIVDHLPLLLDREGARLLGHVARGNPLWRRLDGGAPLIAVFHGPHAYVSPTSYRTVPAVPTWSYAVVHVSGTARCTDRDRTRETLRRLVSVHEAGQSPAFDFEGLPAEFVERQLDHIVGFEAAIERVQAKFKLGQNKSPEDRAAALSGLEHGGDPHGRELSAFAREFFRRRARGAG